MSGGEGQSEPAAGAESHTMTADQLFQLKMAELAARQVEAQAAIAKSRRLTVQNQPPAGGVPGPSPGVNPLLAGAASTPDEMPAQNQTTKDLLQAGIVGAAERAERKEASLLTRQKSRLPTGDAAKQLLAAAAQKAAGPVQAGEQAPKAAKKKHGPAGPKKAIAKKKTRDAKQAQTKKPRGPKRGKNGYQLFCDAQRETVNRELNTSAFGTVSSELGKRWHALQPTEQYAYKEQARLRKAEAVDAVDIDSGVAVGTSRVVTSASAARPDPVRNARLSGWAAPQPAIPEQAAVLKAVVTTDAEMQTEVSVPANDRVEIIEDLQTQWSLDKAETEDAKRESRRRVLASEILAEHGPGARGAYDFYEQVSAGHEHPYIRPDADTSDEQLRWNAAVRKLYEQEWRQAKCAKSQEQDPAAVQVKKEHVPTVDLSGSQ